MAAIKKPVISKIKKLTKRKVKSLVSWQVHRKEALGAG